MWFICYNKSLLIDQVVAVRLEMVTETHLTSGKPRAVHWWAPWLKQWQIWRHPLVSCRAPCGLAPPSDECRTCPCLSTVSTVAHLVPGGWSKKMFHVDFTPVSRFNCSSQREQTVLCSFSSSGLALRLWGCYSCLYSVFMLMSTRVNTAICIWLQYNTLLQNPGSWHSFGCYLTQAICTSTLTDRAHPLMAPARPDDSGSQAEQCVLPYHKPAQEQHEEQCRR